MPSSKYPLIQIADSEERVGRYADHTIFIMEQGLEADTSKFAWYIARLMQYDHQQPDASVVSIVDGLIY